MLDVKLHRPHVYQESGACQYLAFLQLPVAEASPVMPDRQVVVRVGKRNTDNKNSVSMLLPKSLSTCCRQVVAKVGERQSVCSAR